MLFRSTNTFVFLSYNKKYDRFIIKTTDQGITWEHFSYFPVFTSKIYFIDNKIGFTNGSLKVNTGVWKDIIFKTSNGGESWKVKLDTLAEPYQGVKEFRFCDEMNGIAFGYYNNLWRTSDCGETWELDTSFLHHQNYAKIKDIAYPSRNVVFACSDNRSIFKYTENSNGIFEEITVSKSEEMWISPNPVVDDYNIGFFLDNPSEVEMYVYNTTGELRQKIIAGYMLQGMNSVTIPSAKLSVGVYFVIIKTKYNKLKGKFLKLN